MALVVAPTQNSHATAIIRTCNNIREILCGGGGIILHTRELCVYINIHVHSIWCTFPLSGWLGSALQSY